MKWLKKHLTVVMWLGALAIIAGAMLIFESDQLWKVQEKNLCLYSVLFLKEQMLNSGLNPLLHQVFYLYLHQ